MSVKSKKVKGESRKIEGEGEGKIKVKSKKIKGDEMGFLSFILYPLSFIPFALSWLLFAGTAYAGVGYVVRVEENLVYTDLVEKYSVREGTILEIRRLMSWGEELPIGRIIIIQVSDRVSVGKVFILRPGAKVSILDQVYTKLTKDADFDAPIPEAPPDVPIPQDAHAEQENPSRISRLAESKLRAFVPGWEQIHRNEKLKGGMILGLEVAAIASAVVFQKISDNAYDDYLTMPMDSKADVERIRQAFRKSDRTLKISDGLFVTAGIVYLYNVMDGYFLGSASGSEPSEAGNSLRMYLHPNSVALRWTIPF